MFPNISALPVLTVEMKKIQVLKYGTKVKLSCKITTESDLKSVKWFRGEQQIHYEFFENKHEMDDLTRILTLNEINEDDIGEYKCEAHNEKGSSISEPIHVVYG